MSFASPLFLWYFMPAVLAAVLLAPRSWRNGVIVVASLVFYAVGAGATTLLLLGTGSSTAWSARASNPTNGTSRRCAVADC